MAHNIVSIMREALQGALDEKPCDRCAHGEKHLKDCKHDGRCWVVKAHIALSMPVRNIDLFDSGDRSGAWRKFIKNKKTTSPFDWLLDIAEEGK